MKNILLTVATFIVGLTACTSSKSVITERLVVDTIGTERVDSVADIKIHVAYPTHGPAALVDSLRHFVAHTFQIGTQYGHAEEDADKNHFVGNPALVNDGQALLAAVSQHEYNCLKNESDEFKKVFQDNLAAVTCPVFESQCDITLLYESDSYVTFLVHRYDYLGGPHGSTFLMGSTFSKADGKQLGWSLLKDTESTAFQKLIREGVRKYFQDSTNDSIPDEQLNDWLILESGTMQIPLPAVAPYLTADGVAFVYQQYEIAPYAAGLPSFTVSYADIRPFLSSTALTLLAKR